MATKSLKLRLDFLTSKPPPGNQTESQLRLTRDIVGLPAEAHEPIDRLLKAVDAAAKGLPNRFATLAAGGIQLAIFELAHANRLLVLDIGRTRKYESTEEQREAWKHMENLGKEVVAMLPSAEFWQALRVNGNAWAEGDDIPQGEVAFEFGSGSSAERWAHSTPLIPAESYATSLHLLQEGMESEPHELGRMRAAAAMPELLIALGLGLQANLDQHPYTCTLIDVVTAVASVAVQRLKHCIRVPRPTEAPFRLSLTPALSVPDYSAFPAGHATVGAALVTVLAKLCETRPEQTAALEDLAFRIAQDRERAGLHCSVDNREGLALGRAIGGWMVMAVDEPSAFRSWSALFMRAAQEWDPPEPQPDQGALKKQRRKRQAG